MISVGIDLVDIEEFTQSIKRTPDVQKRLFSADEQKTHKHATVQNLAAWFAVKEAIMKAIWNRINVSIEWHDIFVKHGSEGQPFVELSQSLLSRIRDVKIGNISISLSHVSRTAAAVALVEIQQKTKTDEE